MDVTFLRMPNRVGSCPPHTNTFVFVVSAPTNFKRRESLRRTWMAREERSKMRQLGIFSVFLMGSPAEDTPGKRVSCDL
jgi:hypothetical protein